jgi:hypothetical protein
VRHEIATRFDAGRADFRLHPGAAPAAPPATRGFWAARSVGPGTRTLAWTPRQGGWRIVVMNADGSAGVHAELAVGARFPHLLWLGVGALGAGIVLLLLGVCAIWIAAPRSSGRSPESVEERSTR